MIDPEVEQHRRLGIAATDAAPIAGLSTFKSAADVWLDKKHPELVADREESPELYWGIIHEPIIIAEYTKRVGVKSEKPGLIRNAKVEWLMCQPDGQLGGKMKGLEAKTAGGYNSHQWGPAGTDLIPMYHMIQCQHSMMVTGWREWDVAALIGGNDFRIYHLFLNKEITRELFEVEREFYVNFIKGKQTPPIDWGKNVARFAQMKWPKSKAGEKFDVDAHGDATLKDALMALVKARDDQDAAEKAEAINKTLIQSYMKDSEALWWAEGHLGISWKNTRDGVKVDKQAIIDRLLPHVTLSADEKAVIFKECTEEKPGGRRFLVQDKHAKE